MKIAMFSTEDVRGGAARACARLNYGFLNSKGVHVKYYVKNKIEDLASTTTLNSKNYNNDLIELNVNQFYINKNRTDLSSTLYSFTYSRAVLPDLSDFDIINLHWIERFISLENIYELTFLNKPIVWTLHDMKPFSGGCHYSSTCRGYESDCSDCLQILDDEKKLAKNVLRVKKKILKNANITIVAPSVWLADEAKKSSLFKDKRIEVIPNGIDSTVFKPIDKKMAKRELGIDADSIVLTFGAMSHEERRKGFKELFQAMELLKEKTKGKKVVALFFGKSSNEKFPLNVINIGSVNCDEKLSYVYSAADIFILPSLEDNLPNTILEALSCETPIVAFNTGGAKDIINDSNGKIVPKGDIQALCDEVYGLIENESMRIQKGKNGRSLILNKYQLHHQSSSYLKLFEELKNQNFNYTSLCIDVNSCFDEIIAFVFRNNMLNKARIFSQMYNKFYEKINSLHENYIIYGYGTIGKTIHTLISEQIVGYVDMADEKNHPKNLKDMDYDKIIISVLGREEEIVEYLVGELNIDQEKIITLKI